MVYVDFRFYENRDKLDAKKKAKISIEHDDIFLDVVKKAVKKRLEKETPGVTVSQSDVDKVMKHIRHISCNAADQNQDDLCEWLWDPKAKIGKLNSLDTPIFETDFVKRPLGLDVELPLVREQSDSTQLPPKKKAKVSAIDYVMGRAVKGMQYLQYEGDLDKRQEIDEQIKEKLYEFYEEIDLGYADGKQKTRLVTNSSKIKNALCFVQKHWKALLRAYFPHIPRTDDFDKSKLLSALAKTHRHKVKKVQISSEDISTHIATLSALMWNDFAIPAFKDAIVCSWLDTKNIWGRRPRPSCKASLTPRPPRRGE